jgi:hypothetical protein
VSDPRIFVPCPACHLMDYCVLYEEATNRAHVLCKNCSRELLSVAMAPMPEPPPRLMRAPI